jgi:hypothetical protein
MERIVDVLQSASRFLRDVALGEKFQHANKTRSKKKLTEPFPYNYLCYIYFCQEKNKKPGLRLVPKITL